MSFPFIYSTCIWIFSILSHLLFLTLFESFLRVLSLFFLTFIMFYHIHSRSLSICSLSLSLCLFHFCITFTSVSFYLCLLHILSLYLYFNESLFLLPSVILISFFLCTCHPLSLSFSIVCSFSILFFIKYMLVISLYSYPPTVQYK